MAGIDAKKRSQARCYVAMAALGLVATVGLLVQFGVCMENYGRPFGGGKVWDDSWLIENGQGSDLLQITASRKPSASFVSNMLSKITEAFPDYRVVTAKRFVTQLDRLPKRPLGEVWFSGCQHVEFVLQGRGHYHLEQAIRRSFNAAKNDLLVSNAGMPSIFYFLLALVAVVLAVGTGFIALDKVDKLPGGCRSLFCKSSRVEPDPIEQQGDALSTLHVPV